MTGNDIVLLSTVVAPDFGGGTLVIEAVTSEELPGLLEKVTRNLNGHPVTNGVLREVCPSLPEAEKAFWKGEGRGLAVRPRGGVRGAAAAGDTPVVSLDDLEACLVTYTPR